MLSCQILTGSQAAACVSAHLGSALRPKSFVGGASGGGIYTFKVARSVRCPAEARRDGGMGFGLRELPEEVQLSYMFSADLTVSFLTIHQVWLCQLFESTKSEMFCISAHCLLDYKLCQLTTQYYCNFQKHGEKQKPSWCSNRWAHHELLHLETTFRDMPGSFNVFLCEMSQTQRFHFHPYV